MDELSSFRRLIEQLHKKTLSKQLNWQLRDSGRFEVSIGNGSVRMYKTENEFEGDDYTIEICDIIGNVTDSFDDTVVDSGMREEHGKLIYYPKLAEMYKMIRRQATGADDVLRSILNELE